VISADIVAQIEGGLLTPGDRLPSEQELSARFGVSRMTVRQALGRLETQGILTRRQGSGTFVSQPRQGHRDADRLGFHNEIGLDASAITTRELARDVLAPEAEIADALGLKPEQTVVHLVRLRYVEGVAVSLQESWVPYVTAPDLARLPLESGSLYQTLEKLGVTISGAEQEVTAAAASLEVASALGLEPGHPVIAITRKAWSSGRIVEYARSYTLSSYPIHTSVGGVG
jgi:DNA-binding GntR family transcriptional regulator